MLARQATCCSAGPNRPAIITALAMPMRRCTTLVPAAMPMAFSAQLRAAMLRGTLATIATTRSGACGSVRRALPRSSKEKAEELPVVGGRGGNGKRKVERQRRRSHSRHVDAEAKAGRNAELIG